MALCYITMEDAWEQCESQDFSVFVFWRRTLWRGPWVLGTCYRILTEGVTWLEVCWVSPVLRKISISSPWTMFGSCAKPFKTSQFSFLRIAWLKERWDRLKDLWRLFFVCCCLQTSYNAWDWCENFWMGSILSSYYRILAEGVTWLKVGGCCLSWALARESRWMGWPGLKCCTWRQKIPTMKIMLVLQKRSPEISGTFRKNMIQDIFWNKRPRKFGALFSFFAFMPAAFCLTRQSQPS